MAEPFIAEIKMFAGNFAPRNYAFCNGQLLPISQNQALFSLVGTIYGGDGRTTFGLPDLRGRCPMHWGQGPGLSNRNIGQKGGQENVTLNSNQMPSHAHTGRVAVTSNEGSSADPTDKYPAGTEEPNAPYKDEQPTGYMAGGSVLTDNTGGGGSHDNMTPYLAITFIIALQGIFPSRN